MPVPLFTLVQTFACLSISAAAAMQPAQQPPAQPEPPPQPVEVQTPPVEIKVRDPNAKPEKPAAAAPGQINTADDLLAALETADADLRSLAAGIRYDRTFEIQGDQQIREGMLYFLSQPAGARNDRKFAITFNKLIVGSRVRDAKDDPSVKKEYIFDGEWLVEKLPGEKPPMFSKRQVVPPGERFDPLRIGEGPMPIPIGQRRQDILDRYTAELVPADAGLDDPDLKKFVLGSYQLKLTPRPERIEDDEFREIRLWYRRDGGVAAAGAKPAEVKPGALLPRMARTVNRSGDESIVQLINVQVNKPESIDAKVMDTRTPGPKDGWDVQITPYRAGVKDDQPTTPPAAPASNPR